MVWTVPFSLATTGGISVIYFPPGTEMFHFPGFSLHTYEFSMQYMSCDMWVSPFGYSRIKACLGAPRDFSHPATSFFAF